MTKNDPGEDSGPAAPTKGEPPSAPSATVLEYAKTPTRKLLLSTRLSLLAAWGSALAGGVIGAVCLLCPQGPGQVGVRPPEVLAFYIVLMVLSAVSALAAVISLLGIRSRRTALYIIPGALLGMAVSGFSFLASLLFYSTVGERLS